MLETQSFLCFHRLKKDKELVLTVKDVLLAFCLAIIGSVDWTGSACDEGAEAAEWFSTFLCCPTRLVHFNGGANLCFLLAFPFTWNMVLHEIFNTYGEL